MNRRTHRCTCVCMDGRTDGRTHTHYIRNPYHYIMPVHLSFLIGHFLHFYFQTVITKHKGMQESGNTFKFMKKPSAMSWTNR